MYEIIANTVKYFVLIFCQNKLNRHVFYVNETITYIFMLNWGKFFYNGWIKQIKVKYKQRMNHELIDHFKFG